MMTASERIRQIEALVSDLIEVNREIPVVVEGSSDVRCLRRLGLQGDLIKVHGGKSLYEFCADLSACHARVLLLTDWDGKGQKLHHQLTRDLEADWQAQARFREELIRLCSPEIQEVEHIGRLLKRLKVMEEMSGNQERPSC